MLVVLILSISGLTVAIWQGISISPETDGPRNANPSNFALLATVKVPAADLAQLAEQLGGRGQIDMAFPAPVQSNFDIGNPQRFWVTNRYGSRFQIETTLRLETTHSRMWVQDGLDMDYQRLADLGLALGERIFPGVLLLVGNDPASQDMVVDFIFTDKLGLGVAGYFSPDDMISSKISATSNGRRNILISDKLAEDLDGLTRLVAHELQHLIHWELDRNETVWMQEGFSGFIAQLFRQDRDPRSLTYLSEPDLQLNYWPLEGNVARHYGAASLLINYLNDHFGPEFVAALARHPDNGLEALDSLMNDSKLWDPTRNRHLTTEDVVLDWGLANYLQHSFGPYGYYNKIGLSTASATDYISPCKEVFTDQRVSQYGFDYYRVQCDEAGVLEFSGGPYTKLLPTTPHSGQYFFWSNRGDLIDTRLTRQFDFTEVEGPLTLQFWTWYELEEGSDFVYLLASEDEQNWDFLETTSGNAAGDTVGKQFGFGYSGINRRFEWSKQIVDLSKFSGKRVTLRFEYVSDTSRMGEGFLIDDLSVVETNYQADFEDGSDGWESEGFVRVNNTIPQQFRVALVRSDGPLTVDHLSLDSSNRARVSLEAGEEVVLIVMGATRHTRQPASYSLFLSQ